MSLWDPVDPGDEVDLWFDFAPQKPFLASAVVISTAVVTVPDGVTLLGGTGAIEGHKVKFRAKPDAAGKYKINCALVLDTGEKFNADAYLTVKERVVQ